VKLKSLYLSQFKIFKQCALWLRNSSTCNKHEIIFKWSEILYMKITFLIVVRMKVKLSLCLTKCHALKT